MPRVLGQSQGGPGGVRAAASEDVHVPLAVVSVVKTYTEVSASCSECSEDVHVPWL